MKHHIDIIVSIITGTAFAAIGISSHEIEKTIILSSIGACAGFFSAHTLKYFRNQFLNWWKNGRK